MSVPRYTDEQYADLQRRLRPRVVATVNEGAETAKNGLRRVSAKGKATTLPAPPERDVLAAVLAACEMHPRIAWAYRFNVGANMIDGRWVKFAFPGCADILGQLTTGELLAVECKREGCQPTEAQQQFLFTVARAGGVAFVARSADDVWKALPTRGEAA